LVVSEVVSMAAGAIVSTRVLVVPQLYAGPWGEGEEPSRVARITAARARFGAANVELPRGERAHETAARVAALPHGEWQILGGVHDEAAVALLIDALHVRGLAARRFESDDGAGAAAAAGPAGPAFDPTGAARLELLLRALGVDPALAIYAGNGLRERNADGLVNLR
jgi:hypothetical protein